MVVQPGNVDVIHWEIGQIMDHVASMADLPKITRFCDLPLSSSCGAIVTLFLSFSQLQMIIQYASNIQSIPGLPFFAPILSQVEA